MIVLGVLARFSLPAIIAIGAIMIGGHNLLDGIRSANPLWVILHQPGFVIQGSHSVFAAYTLIPWIGVTLLGYGLGAVFEWDPIRRRRLLVRIGALATVAFLVLRALGLYGDPVPWSRHATAIATMLSFVNANKYPPSLLFLLMTLGPALLFLAALDARTPRALGPTVAYGRAPLFFYAVHWVVIHGAAVVVCFALYGSAHWMFESPSVDKYPFTQPPGWGVSLLTVYLVWVGVVALLYPACRWFAGLKARRGGALRYF